MSSDREHFHIALIGDFSARGHGGIVETGRTLAARRPIRVDRDNLDAVIARLAPTLSLRTSDGEAVTIRFAALDDFHPDSLYQRLPVFRALRDAGERAAAGGSLGAEPPRATPPTSAGVLDAILGAAPPPPGGAALAAPAISPARELADTELSAFVSRAVAPHVVRQPADAELAAEARTREAIAAAMREILHHADFQAVEALWRGLALLVRRLETDGLLQIHLIDVTPSEIAAHVGDVPGDESGIYRLLLDERSQPWALLAAAFPLGDDTALLGKLGVLARDAGAPLVADAHPSVAGIRDIVAASDPDDWDREESEEWQELRASSVAPWIALAFPRLLLRIPYGRDGEPCELFSFEEAAADAHLRHDELLWGSGAIACSLVLGTEFAERGWNVPSGGEISGLPLHVYKVHGEAFAVPVAELAIGERTAVRLIDRGLSPLVPVRDTDTLALPLVQSVAPGLTALRGPWNAR